MGDYKRGGGGEEVLTILYFRDFPGNVFYDLASPFLAGGDGVDLCDYFWTSVKRV